MSHPSTDPAIPPLLAAARAAAGGPAWQQAHALQFEGRISAGGLQGPYSQRIALGDGRFVIDYRLGPAALARGFDGTAGWHRGADGAVVVQQSVAALQALVTEAWLLSRAWLQPGRDAAAMFTPAGEREAPEGRLSLLRCRPAGGDELLLGFDAASGRLLSSEQVLHGKVSVKRYEDHRWIDGLLLPMRTVSGGGDPRHEVLVQLDVARVNPPLPAAAFERPDAAPPPTGLAAGTVACELPVAWHQNHAYLDARINGAPMRLMLDSGGVNLLTPEAAARAGLAIEGATEVRGPGRQPVSAGFARARELVLGDGALRLQDSLLRVLPLAGLSVVEGTAIDGLLGFELFSRLVLRLDGNAGRLQLIDPQAFVPPPGAQRLDLRFYAHVPAVRARVDGIEGEFWLDTGNRNALTLFKPFVAAHPQLADGAGAETVIGHGIGGAVGGRVAPGRPLALGALVLDVPALTLPCADEGVTAIGQVAGNIGGALLRQRVVSFDYRRSAVYFER
ncbi:aspartyl protease family protein [Aquabacterium sp.]|uniref:aspartyl protease family protein n=1 Tax=Aquabacterium sp. TaxID=1872578 RepID=UPI0037849C66